ncbi:MAG: hypothetical protein MUE44_07985 [Oscillatoriaceae cyanobacterium Prado104]|jgi:hypothetical protein|nr:hypothetical protein [Oscillatoriaceae cyanobacterium Prado104]
MPYHKPLQAKPKTLYNSKERYNFQGKPYQHLRTEIKLTSFKTVATAILLGLPYLGVIYALVASGAQIVAIILVLAGIAIGGSIGLLYYLNREEPVKPPAHPNKRR